MRKDLKTGMLVGAIVVIAAVVAMSVWGGQSVESRLRRSRTIGGDETTVEETSGGKQHHKLPPAEPEPVAKHTMVVEKSEAGSAIQIETVPETKLELARIEEEREVQIHVVTGGETLSSISVMYYNSSRQWRKILDANPKVIADENRLLPGMRLVIPR